MQLFVYDCLDRPFHIGDYFTTMPLRRYRRVQVGRVLGFKEIKGCDGSKLRLIVRTAQNHWKYGWKSALCNAVLEGADLTTIVSTSSIPPKLVEVLGSIPEVPTGAQITLSE